MTTPPPPADASRPAVIVNGAWLDAQHFPPVHYVVDRVLAEGLTILVGGPKIGKSWLTLGLVLAIASGELALGVLPTTAAPCLLAALEDGYRRIQGRARHLLGEGVPIPVALDIVIKGSHAELVLAIKNWLEQHRYSQPVVVIDTLGRFRPQRASTSDTFGADYRFIASLKEIIDEIPGGAIILVHHTRKSGAAEDGDFVEAVSGTTGLAAAADATLVLRRRRHEDGALLAVTGRDIREAEYALVSENGRWRLDGMTLDEAAQTAKQAHATDSLGDRSTQILQAVIAAPNGTTPKDIAHQLGMSNDDAGQYLRRLADAGRIRKAGRGRYVSEPSEVSEPPIDFGQSDGSDTVRQISTWRGSGQPVEHDGDVA